MAPPVAPRLRHFLSWPVDHTTEFGHTVINRYLYGLPKQKNQAGKVKIYLHLVGGVVEKNLGSFKKQIVQFMKRCF